MRTALLLLLLASMPAAAEVAEFNKLCYISEHIWKTKDVTLYNDNSIEQAGCVMAVNTISGTYHLNSHVTNSTDESKLSIYEAYYDTSGQYWGFKAGRVPAYYGMYSVNRLVKPLQDFIIYPTSIYRDNVWPTANAIDGVSLYAHTPHKESHLTHAYYISIGRPIDVNSPEVSFELSGVYTNELSNSIAATVGGELNTPNQDFRLDVQTITADQAVSDSKKQMVRAVAGYRYYFKRCNISIELSKVHVKDLNHKASGLAITSRTKLNNKTDLNLMYDTSCKSNAFCITDDSSAKYYSAYTSYSINHNLKVQLQHTIGTGGGGGLNSSGMLTASNKWSSTVLGVIASW